MTERVTWKSRVAGLLVFALVFMVALPPDAGAATIKVPAGTSVSLRTSQTIAPQGVKAGDSVSLVVASDVVVDGKVVIRAGAPAKGEVVQSEQRGIVGKPDRVSVQIQSVTAVDGSTVPVSATKSAEGEDKVVLTVILALICLPLIFLKGGEAAIGAGAGVNAITNGVAEVKVASAVDVTPAPEAAPASVAAAAIE